MTVERTKIPSREYRYSRWRIKDVKICEACGKFNTFELSRNQRPCSSATPCDNYITYDKKRDENLKICKEESCHHRIPFFPCFIYNIDEKDCPNKWHKSNQIDCGIRCINSIKGKCVMISPVLGLKTEGWNCMDFMEREVSNEEEVNLENRLFNIKLDRIKRNLRNRLRTL